jgi:sigma-E factor negative regulatory protein RseC
MIETKVRVLHADDGMAWVEATEQNGCGACQAKSACAVSGLGRFFSSRRRPIPVCADDARPGEQYTVAMREADFLKVGLLAYLMPSLLAVLGASIASAYDMGDAWSVIGMALGFLLGLLLASALSSFVAPPIALHSSPESISLAPSPRPAHHGWRCIASRLRGREVVLPEIPSRPARGRGELRASLRDVHVNLGDTP